MSLKKSLRLVSIGNAASVRWPKLIEPKDIVFARAQIESQAAGLTPLRIPARELLQIKERLLQAAQSGTIDQVKHRDWRYAPWVFWLQDDAVANNQLIVETFFAKATSRNSSSWIKSLIFAYFTQFPVASPTLSRVAGRLQSILAAQQWPSIRAWYERHQQLKLFDPANAPRYLAGHLLNCSSIQEGLSALGLDASITQAANNQFMASSYQAALEFSRNTLSNSHAAPETVLERLIEWSLPVPASNNGLRYPHLLGALAESMLLPWSAKQPDAQLKERIKKFLLARIGDPRLHPGAWQQVNPRATEIFRKWLAGETLLQFFDLLSRTADDIWAYRKKFWMAYYNKGAIGDAWFSLGQNAYALGRQLKLRQPELTYATLSGAAADQSVLIMHLGDFVVAEWSHSGKCRFWRNTDRRAPKLYEKYYDANDLRAICQYEQIHYSSANGTWQRQIANFLRHETQIYIPEYEWMM